VKRKDKLIFQMKGFRPSQYKNPKKCAQFVHPSISTHQQKFPSHSGNRPIEKEREKAEDKNKLPLHCWGCGGAHMLIDFPHR
jgi:ribosomal protein L44E